MSTRKLNAKTIFRLVSVLLVMALTLEFSASPVQALNYDASDSVFVQDAKASKNNEWDVTQISKQLLLAETEKDDARAGEDTAQEEQDAVQAGGDDSQAGDTSQEEVPMLANDIIVYLESGTMGTMSVEDDSSGTSDQSGIADNVILMAPQPGETVEQALDRMRSSPGVEYAEPNYLLYTQYYSGYINDPLYSEQWALEEIEMSFAWSNAREILSNNEPSPVIVAVIDTGVDSDHEDFRYEDPESEGTVVNRVLEGCNVISEPYSQDTADDSYNGHGTHIAGIIAAATYNNKGIAGTAGGVSFKRSPHKSTGRFRNWYHA
jgi:subtilisin family serine protease